MNRPSAFWKIAGRLCVCALLLVWIFHTIFLSEGELAAHRQNLDWNSLDRSAQWQLAWTHGPSGLWSTLALADRTALALSFGAMGATLLLGILRWHGILQAQGLHLSWTRCAEISLVAHFFNSFLLGSTGGDLFKAYFAARETHHQKTEAVTTVFIDRLIGLFSMLVFAGVFTLANLNIVLSHEHVAAPAALVLALLIACSILIALSLWGGLSKRWPQARSWLQRLPKAAHLERSLQTCRRFGSRTGLLLRTFLLSIALNLACILQFNLLARGLQLEIPLAFLAFAVPAIISIAALPITPSGLGVRENLFVVILGIPEINVPPTQALALSLLAFAGSLAWSIVGGLVYLGFRDKHHLREVARDAGPDVPSSADP